MSTNKAGLLRFHEVQESEQQVNAAEAVTTNKKCFRSVFETCGFGDYDRIRVFMSASPSSHRMKNMGVLDNVKLWV